MLSIVLVLEDLPVLRILIYIIQDREHTLLIPKVMQDQFINSELRKKNIVIGIELQDQAHIVQATNFQKNQHQDGGNINILIRMGSARRPELSKKSTVPGPGTYTQHSKVGEGPKYGIRPKSALIKQSDTPGPGQYTPKKETVTKRPGRIYLLHSFISKK